jgi:hypothetical protein
MTGTSYIVRAATFSGVAVSGTLLPATQHDSFLAASSRSRGIRMLHFSIRRSCARQTSRWESLGYNMDKHAPAGRIEQHASISIRE